MRQERPNPDELLKQVQADEARRSRGKLKVFLGGSAGVGKTYAMLSEAQEQKARGSEVVVGYLETHRRKETDRLAEGLETLPLREVEHRGVVLKEFDLDSALARNPRLLLVDELAHTNAVGSRHPKRYQDIDELLQAGIDVYTTVNIQHLESLNDVVAQITGVNVRETIPDSVIERADELEFVDIPPEELRQRLREGKVYQPDRVEHALDGFFRAGNLSALREIALRRMADRVDAQMRSYRAENKVDGLWPASERLLVCIAPNQMASRVVRSAARIGAASHAEMIAVYVESDRQTERPADEQREAQEALRLAERLGMETLASSGHDIVAEILRIAQERNVSLIVVGKPIKPRWQEIIHGSVVDDLVRRSGALDVYVVTSEAEKRRSRKLATQRVLAWIGYAVTVLVALVCTAICFLLAPHVSLTNLIMIYLLGVAFIATRFGSREAALASVLSVAAFDFFFVPPIHTLEVGDTQYLLTFAIMLGVGLLISGLALRLRLQAKASQSRERRTAALYTLSRDLAKTRSRREIASIAAREIGSLFEAEVAVMLAGDSGELDVAISTVSRFEDQPSERAVANYVLQKGEPGGMGTDTLPSAAALYVPLVATRGVVGVLGVKAATILDSQQENLLETFANGLALAFERILLAKESSVARISAESERMRNVLLNSVSHDLRTPLTVINGAASSIVEGNADARGLASTIMEQSDRLNRHVQNLLDMTRLEARTIDPQVEWNSIEELIGSALAQTDKSLAGREIHTYIPPGLALVNVDGMLVEKALVNLLENAAHYTPAGSPVTIRVSTPVGKLRILVEDKGPGIPQGDEAKIFDKFYQPHGRTNDGGHGLGLAICRAVAEAHGGRAWAENRAGGGARFIIELATAGRAPEVTLD